MPCTQGGEREKVARAGVIEAFGVHRQGWSARLLARPLHHLPEAGLGHAAQRAMLIVRVVHPVDVALLGRLPVRASSPRRTPSPLPSGGTIPVARAPPRGRAPARSALAPCADLRGPRPSTPPTLRPSRQANVARDRRPPRRTGRHLKLRARERCAHLPVAPRRQPSKALEPGWPCAGMPRPRRAAPPSPDRAC